MSCQGAAVSVSGMQVEVDMMRAIAEDGRVDLLAIWTGVLIRGGHTK